MADVKGYRELQVWQRSYELALAVYKVTTDFPRDEVYGLTAQMRRAAVSIPSNIAEGHSRGHTADFIRFARISRGSLAELQTQLLLARDLGYLMEDAHEPLAAECRELELMVSGLIRSLAAKL